MQKTSCDLNLIFNAIKCDNLVAFSQLIKGNENICFGAFPILSVCYLYNAKKIARKYQKQLCGLSTYNIVPENFEIYKKFSTVAGRAMRLYTNNRLVSPLEMLAILQKDFKIKKHYKSFYKNQTIIDNLKVIYKDINNQSIKINSATIKLGVKKLKFYEKTYYKNGILFSSISCAVLIIIFALCAVTTGVSLPFSASKVYNQNQLVSALKYGGNFTLQNDIDFDKQVNNITFNGTLDGNGKTLFIKKFNNNFIINNNNGVIKNLNIVYCDFNATITNSLSLFVNKNNKTLQNITVICNNITLTCNQSNKDIAVSAIAITNNALIENCSVSINANLSKTGNGECFIGAVCANNNKTINNCTVTQNSQIQCTDIDAAAITINNSKDATISNCRNYCEISQTSIQNGWSPNVSGIVQANYGNVSHCINYAVLSITSNCETKSSGAVAFLGGIGAMNYGAIDNCLNKGELILTTNIISGYCGGITAYSTYWIDGELVKYGKMQNCGALSNISVTTTDENALAFAGGLSGYFHGEMQNCFSLSTFTNGFDSTKYFLGICIGAGVVGYDVLLRPFIEINASNNFVLDQANVSTQFGCLVYQNVIQYTGQNDASGNIKTLSTQQQIMNSGVYWNE